MSWPLPWAVPLALDAQLEAEAQVRELEEPRLDTVVHYSAGFGANKQGGRGGILAWYFAKLRGQKLPQIKV